MISPQNDEEFGPFGESAARLVNLLFPKVYTLFIIIDPTFSEVGQSNILPQFSKNDCSVVSISSTSQYVQKFDSVLNVFSCHDDLEQVLDKYRFDHVIFATRDLDILTAWAQAEYAVVAFKAEILTQNLQWLEDMRKINVVREIS